MQELFLKLNPLDVMSFSSSLKELSLPCGTQKRC